MEYKQLLSKSEKELNELVAEYKAELFSLRMKNATKQLDKTHSINEVKKNIARVLTALNQKRYDAQRAEIDKIIAAEKEARKEELAKNKAEKEAKKAKEVKPAKKVSSQAATKKVVVKEETKKSRRYKSI